MTYAGDVTPSEAYAAAIGPEDALLVDVRTRAEWTYVGVPVLEGAHHDVAFVEWSTFPDGQVNGRTSYPCTHRFVHPHRRGAALHARALEAAVRARDRTCVRGCLVKGLSRDQEASGSRLRRAGGQIP